MMFLSIPLLPSMIARVGVVREPKISRSFQTRRTISTLKMSKLVLVMVSSGVYTYHAENRDHLVNNQIHNSFPISSKGILTMEAKHKSKLLEPGWSQPPRGQGNLVCCQVPHNLSDTVDILREFGIVRLVPL